MSTLAEFNAQQKARAQARREEAARLFRELGNWKLVAQRMGVTRQRAHALGAATARGEK